MDADALSLLIILRQELQAIVSSMPSPKQPEKDVIEDVLTDNGLQLNEVDSDVGSVDGHVDGDGADDEHKQEDEKAQELQSRNHNQTINKNNTDSNGHALWLARNAQIGVDIDGLIQNYLAPAIKQLNKKRNEHKKKPKRSSVNMDGPVAFTGGVSSQSVSPMRPPFGDDLSASPSQNNDNHHALLSPAPSSVRSHSSHAMNHMMGSAASSFYPPHSPFVGVSAVDATSLRHEAYSNVLSEPGQPMPAPRAGRGGQVTQVMDEVSNVSEKVAHCCRRFVTSLFCGCGLFYTLLIFVVFVCVVMMFVFYKANELTLILKELNHWKELSVKRVEYELLNEQKLAEIDFDVNVDIDKMKAEHTHREQMEVIDAKKVLTQEFIQRNTRTVTTTYWNFLTTETETVSQTIFSEEDIAFFQNNVLYHGFTTPQNAIQPPPQEQADADNDGHGSAIELESDVNDSQQCIGNDATSSKCASATTEHDSFDAI